MYIYGRGGLALSCVWMKERAHRGRTHRWTGKRKEKHEEKSSKVPKKKMPAVVGLDVLSRVELSPLTSSSVAAHVGSSQSRGGFFVMRTAAAHRLTYCSCPSRVSLNVGKKFAVTQILKPVIDVFLFLFSLQLCSFQGTVIHQLE